MGAGESAKATRQGSEHIGRSIFAQPVCVVNSVAWLQIGATVAAIVGALVWAALLEVPVVVQGKGLLLGQFGVAEITMPARGTITRLPFNEGADVKAGDLVALIAQPELRMQLTTKRAMLREAEERLARHNDLNRRTIAAQREADAVRTREAETRITLLGGEFTVLQERDKALRELAQKGMVARDQLLANQAKMHEVEMSIGSARAEIASVASQAALQQLQQERELTTITDQISQLSTEVTELRKLLTAQIEVHSPYAGRIVEMKALAGSYIEAGAPLMTVLRDDDGDPTTGVLRAVAYVGPADGKKVKVGDKVLVAPTSVERSEFGMIRGTVTAVAETAATTAGMMNVLKNDQMVKTLSAGGAPFMVLITLEPSSANKSGYAWSSSSGPNALLTAGTVADSEIVVQQRRLLGVVIPPLARLLRAE
ncbi:MAG: NHLP bacteriocin system secretion protein [Reyranella sp.]|nr:NHLP bacteriocin system secretion protein [Reyranella sp.]